LRVGRAFFLRRWTSTPQPIATSIATSTPFMPVVLRDLRALDVADAPDEADEATVAEA